MLVKYELLKSDRQRNRIFYTELKEIIFLTVNKSRNITVSAKHYKW